MDRHSELRRTIPLNPGDARFPRTPFKPRESGLKRTSFSSSSTLSRGAGGTGRAETPQQAKRAEQLREWKQLRELVLERDDWTCVRCGRTDLRLECHHRRHKGQGGSRLLDVPSNVVTLCGWGNHTGDHGWAHGPTLNTDVAAVGLTVLWGESPLEVPVLYPDGIRYRLDDDGGRCVA